MIEGIKMKKYPVLLALIVLTGLITSACVSQTAEVALTQLPTLESVSETVDEQVVVNTTVDISQDTYVTLYEEVNPGVVAINVYSQSAGAGQGSGFMFDRDGHILTNYHVVETAEEIEVVFTSGYRTKGILVGTDLDSDIAVVQVDAPSDEIHPLPLGSSANVKVGQTVVAIGNPYGLSGTMTVGIVSARGRMLESMREAPSGGYFTAADLIQTDAAINPGNSGGPLLNLNGEVIGINRAIRTNGDDGVLTLSNSGIGFAVPIDIVRRVTPYLIETGKYDYPYLGIVSREELSLQDRETIGIEADVQGAYVISVTEGGPAERAGIVGGGEYINYNDLPAGGDLIIAVDDQPVRTFSELLRYLVTYKSPGDAMDVTVLRDGEDLTFSVILTSRAD
jgi:2-alkenal reductase